MNILVGNGSDDACLDGFGHCTNIFSSIMDVVGDKNVRMQNFFHFFQRDNGTTTSIFISNHQMNFVIFYLQYYDIRKICQGSLCYDFSGMETYLNDDQVKQALGVPTSIDFVSCSSTVYQAMEADWMKNLEVGIPQLLEDGINLLIYAGEYDLICNWLGKLHSPVTQIEFI